MHTEYVQKYASGTDATKENTDGKEEEEGEKEEEEDHVMSDVSLSDEEAAGEMDL
jgi:hypothetical protein